MTTVSTKLLFDQTIQFIGKNINALNDAQRKVASGLEYKSYDELVGGVGRAKGLQGTVAGLNAFNRSIDRVDVRLNTYDLTLQQMTDIAISFRDEINISSNPGNEAFDLGSQAEGILKQIGQLLNTSVDGIYLFGGTKNNAPPVNSNLSSTPNYASSSADPFTPNANYYNGDNGQMSVRISERRSLEYGFTADDPAFKNLIAAAHLAMEASAEGNNVDKLNQALDLMESAISGIINMRSENGSTSKQLELAREQNKDAELTLTDTLDGLVNADIVEASIIISLRQSVLQATFQSFSTISSLKLSDYIR